MRAIITHFRGGTPLGRFLTPTIRNLQPGATLLINLEVTEPVALGDSFRIEVPIPETPRGSGPLRRFVRNMTDRVVRTQAQPFVVTL